MNCTAKLSGSPCPSTYHLPEPLFPSMLLFLLPHHVLMEASAQMCPSKVWLPAPLLPNSCLGPVHCPACGLTASSLRNTNTTCLPGLMMFHHHEESISYLADSKYSISDVTINVIIPIITLAGVSQCLVAGVCNAMRLSISVDGKSKEETGSGPG